MAFSADKAARISRWMILVVIVGAVFCAGVFTIGLKAQKVEPPVLEPRTFKTPQGGEGGSDSFAAHRDWTEAAELLAWMVPESVTRGLVDARPSGEEQPEQTQQTVAQTNNRSGRSVPPDWRYVGYFGETDNDMALISMGGQQRLIGVGQEVDGFKFTKIQPQLILLASGDDELKMTMSPRPDIELDLPIPTPEAKRPRSGRTADYERFQDRRQFWKTGEKQEEDPS